MRDLTSEFEAEHAAPHTMCTKEERDDVWTVEARAREAEAEGRGA